VEESVANWVEMMGYPPLEPKPVIADKLSLTISLDYA
jgi:hypothetical protein